MSIENSKELPTWLDRFGRCAACMRKSFAAAAMTWLALSLLASLAGGHLPRTVTLPALALAAGLTALWLLHLAALAARATQHSQGQHENSTGRSQRRDFLLVFARSMVGAALLTSIPAFAQSGGCGSCTGQCSQVFADCKQGNQASCYLAAACLCQCNLDNGGCGSSREALQQCIDQNNQAAKQLG